MGAEHGGAVERAQIWPDIDQNNLGFGLRGRLFDHAPEPRHHPKCTRLAVETVGPLRRKFVFDQGQHQVADEQPHSFGDRLDVRCGDVALAFEQGAQGAKYGVAVFTIRPERFQPRVIQKR